VDGQKEAAGQAKVIEGHLIYPNHFYTFTEGNIVVDDIPVRIKIPCDQMKVVAWSLLEFEQIHLINMGNTNKPQYLKISAYLVKQHAIEEK
jgi:hypothetical protein